MKREVATRLAVPGGEAGFTLVEALIAMVVFSLVIYLTTTGYSRFLGVWTDGRLLDDRGLLSYRNQVLVRSSLESAFDYYCTDPASEEASRYFPYFQGGGGVVRFVTLSPVFREGEAALATLELTPVTGGERYALWYRECPLAATYIRYVNDPVTYTDGIEVFSDVRSFRMRFARAASAAGGGKATLWTEYYDAREHGRLPAAVELVLVRGAGEERMVFPLRAHSEGKQRFFAPQPGATGLPGAEKEE